MGMEPPAGAPLSNLLNPAACSASARPCCPHARDAAHPSTPDPNARGVPAAASRRPSGAAALQARAAACAARAALPSGAGPRQKRSACGTEAAAAGLPLPAAPAPTEGHTAERPAAPGPAPVPAAAAAAATGAISPSVDPSHAWREGCVLETPACTMRPAAAFGSCLATSPLPMQAGRCTGGTAATLWPAACDASLGTTAARGAPAGAPPRHAACNGRGGTNGRNARRPGSPGPDPMRSPGPAGMPAASAGVDPALGEPPPQGDPASTPDSRSKLGAGWRCGPARGARAPAPACRG